MSYRYIGNKTRLNSILMEEISTLVSKGAWVADIMCGTASVSAALRVEGYHVVASDIMTFASHHARVRLLLNAAPKFSGLKKNYSEVLSYLNELSAKEGVFFREYSPAGTPLNKEEPRKYFTPENAAHIDAVSKKIKAWQNKSLITENENALLRHDLVLAANKVANIAGTYGHYRSKWSTSAKASFKLFPTEFLSGYSTKHKVFKGPAETVARKIQADLCYIDPPYMKRQYAANYHILETLARGDEPEAIGASGLRPWRDQYSNFCSKVKIRDSFREIFNNIDCGQFLISYSEDGLLSEKEMMALFREFGKASLKKIPLKRFKSNSGGAGGTVLEYLFHVVKK